MDQTVNFGEFLEERYVEYMEKVNEDRAFADVEGFKVVQRRILHAMDQLGLGPDSNHKKSARVVGDVLGKYHPHGDRSVYDAMVRMAQPWSLRYPLIDGQGNIGSIDGDAPAAMRYTESRLTPIGYEALKNAAFSPEQPTYDNENTEPTELGTLIPFLLVNGTGGLGVGMSADIPSHNLTEVMNGLIAYVEADEPDLDTLLDHIQGPDMPTGGVIPDDPDQLRSVYESGSGRITHRADYTTERVNGHRAIVITEVPINVQPEDVVESINDLVDDQTDPDQDDPFDGQTRDVIKDIQNQSDEDIRIVITLRRGENPADVVSVLFDETQLERNLANPTVQFRFQDSDGVPRLVDLETTVRRIIDHHHDVLIREYEYKAENLRDDLERLRAYAEVLTDHKTFLDIVGDADNDTEAKDDLHDAFDLTYDEIERVLDLPVRRVTQKNRDDLLDKLKDKEKTLEEYEALLDDEAARTDELIERYETLRDRYGDPRRTRIGASSAPADPQSGSDDSLAVGMADGELVRIPKASWSRFASKTVSQPVRALNRIQTDQDTLIIDETERSYQVPGDRVFDSAMHLSEVKDVDNDPAIDGIVSIPADRSGKILVVQTDGRVRLTELEDYGDPKPKGKLGHSYMDGRIETMTWIPSDADGTVALMNNRRRVIRFDLDELSDQGKKASGYKSMDLPEDGRIVAGQYIPHDQLNDTTVLLVTENNRGKRFPLASVKPQGRNTKGKTVGRQAMEDDPIILGTFYREDDPVLGITDDTIHRIDPSVVPGRKRNLKAMDNTEDLTVYDRIVSPSDPLEGSDHDG